MISFVVYTVKEVLRRSTFNIYSNSEVNFLPIKTSWNVDFDVNDAKRKSSVCMYFQEVFSLFPRKQKRETPKPTKQTVFDSLPHIVSVVGSFSAGFVMLWTVFCVIDLFCHSLLLCEDIFIIMLYHKSIVLQGCIPMR